MSPVQQATVLPFLEARRMVEEHARRLPAPDAEPVELRRALGRVLAEPILADRDFPPFPRATRDGYALRAADLAQVPVRLEVVGEIRAGASPEAFACGLKPGEAVEIMTGAPAPADADAVVMIEYTRRDGDFVVIERAVRSGENIVPAGAETRRGQEVLAVRQRLGPPQIAVAAAVGATQLRVFRRPRVAILATGDEIVDVAAAPGPGQIRNSNLWSLAAQVEAAEAEPVMLPIAPDERESLRSLIGEGLSAGLLLLSGGVSAGRYDLVEDVLAEFQAEFLFTGALIQPGRPVVFGRAPRKPGAAPTHFFGLPGNPVSIMVCFDLFVRPMLDALAGAQVAPLRYLWARLGKDIRTKTGLTRFLPGKLSGEFDETEVELAPWQGSGDIVGTAQANCWVVVPPDRDRIAAQERVAVLVPHSEY